jgi:hypothetical protein
VTARGDAAATTHDPPRVALPGDVNEICHRREA